MLQLNIKRCMVESVRKSQTSLKISDMPRPRTLPLIGTKLDLLVAGSGEKLHEYIDNRHRQLGPIFAERLSGNTELVFISDPAIIKTIFVNLEGKYPIHILPEPWVLYEKLNGSKRGLFFMNGEEWLLNRRIANNHLLKAQAETWIRLPVVETVQTFIEQFKKRAVNGILIKDMESELYKLSMNVIINILLGQNMLPRTQHQEELLTIFASSVKKIFLTTTKLYAWPVNWCQRLNLKVWRDFKDCVDLSLLLANRLVLDMIKNKKESNGLIKRLVDENMNDETIVRIVADFIIAAGDTTAYTTLWILWLLSKNKEVIKDIRAKEDEYVKYAVKEAMRMYPVAPFLTRILPEQTFLGGFMVKGQTPIIASIYTSGRDDQNFSKAHSFLPYRWDRNDPRKASLINHVPSASLPFAMGARSCIGKKIAMLQLTEVISQIVKNFDFECNNTESINAITSQVLIPDKSIELFFTRRNKMD